MLPSNVLIDLIWQKSLDKPLEHLMSTEEI